MTAYGQKAAYLDKLGASRNAGHYVVSEIERMRPAAAGAIEVAAQHS